MARKRMDEEKCSHPSTQQLSKKLSLLRPLSHLFILGLIPRQPHRIVSP